MSIPGSVTVLPTNTMHIQTSLSMTPHQRTSLAFLRRHGLDSDFSGTVEVSLRHPYQWAGHATLETHALAESAIFRFTDGIMHDRAFLHDDVLQCSTAVGHSAALSMIN